MQTHAGRSLCLERLQDRFTPVVYGLPWLNPDRLSPSFVPCYMIVRESAAPA